MLFFEALQKSARLLSNEGRVNLNGIQHFEDPWFLSALDVIWKETTEQSKVCITVSKILFLIYHRIGYFLSRLRWEFIKWRIGLSHLFYYHYYLLCVLTLKFTLKWSFFFYSRATVKKCILWTNSVTCTIQFWHRWNKLAEVTKVCFRIQHNKTNIIKIKAMMKSGLIYSKN